VAWGGWGGRACGFKHAGEGLGATAKLPPQSTGGATLLRFSDEFSRDLCAPTRPGVVGSWVRRLPGSCTRWSAHSAACDMASQHTERQLCECACVRRVCAYGEWNDAGCRKPNGWPLADPTPTARQSVKRPTWIRLRGGGGGGRRRKKGDRLCASS
jgi:hypothetical protein